MSDSDATLSAESDNELEQEDLDDTLPYSYDVGYRIGFDPQAPIIESSDSESESENLELLSHRYVPDGDPAPFSTSFVEEEEEEEENGDVGEEGEVVREVDVGAENQAPKV